MLLHRQQDIVGMSAGGDALGGEGSLIGVDRLHGRNLGERGVVAGNQGFLRIVHRRRQAFGDGVDEVVVAAVRQSEGWVGLARVGIGFYSWVCRTVIGKWSRRILRPAKRTSPPARRTR
jgi:hypothetical protein